MSRRIVALLVPALRVAAVSVAALVLAPGCSSDSPPALGAEDLSDQDRDEVARSLGAALSRSFSSQDGLTGSALDLARGDASATARARAPLGLTVSLDVTCLDEDGASMEACGPSAASATIRGDVEGELSLLGWTGTVAVSVDWQLDGLQDEVAQVQGSADLELTSEFDDWFRPVTHTATFSASADLSATVRQSDRRVTSGSADLSIEYERTRSDDGTVVRFAFTASATLEDGQATVTIGGVRFLIDLDAGSMTRR